MTGNSPRESSVPALSIRQPWAWAILNAGKRIENREWRGGCKYRGPVLIHASLWGGPSIDRLSVAAQDEAYFMINMAKRAGHTFDGPVTLRDLYEHRGGIVGRANVVGVVERGQAVIDGAENELRHPPRDLTPTERAWWVGGFGIVLDDVEPLPFVPCKGALGFFKPRFDVPIESPAFDALATDLMKRSAQP
jgi:hypothetical protein